MTETKLKVTDKVRFLSPPAFVGQEGIIMHQLRCDPSKGRDYEWIVKCIEKDLSVSVMGCELELIK